MIRDWFRYHADWCVLQHRHPDAAKELEEEELVQHPVASSVVEDALNLDLERLVDEHRFHADGASSDDSKLRKAIGDHLQEEQKEEEVLGE